MAERRSLKSVAESIALQLDVALKLREDAERALTDAQRDVDVQDANVESLRHTYNLVKPQPRVRKPKDGAS